MLRLRSVGYPPAQQCPQCGAATEPITVAGEGVVFTYTVAAKSHLTGDFLTYYSKFTDQIVAPAAKQKAVKTAASVVRTAVSELHPDSAKVLVFLNQTTTGNDRPEPTQTASSVVVSLSKTTGNWLISAFDPVSPCQARPCRGTLKRCRWVLAEANHPRMSLVPTLDEARLQSWRAPG